ncbi:MAG: hypothetical protein HY911_04345 [Desulfobacterales bacterium]|nr:hypothetical protein [Desulfobacterales bacterium]
MQPLTLTKHFTQRWMERVGNWPTAEAVRAFLDQSVMVQRCEDMVRQDGQRYRVLAIFWHPELDLIMKVDTLENYAVTVISRNSSSKRCLEIQDVEKEVPVAKHAAPAGIAARIARVREIFGARAAGRRRQACQVS